MKVVINKCFGGFGLSHEAVMRYAELKGIKLYPYVMDEANRNKVRPYKESENSFFREKESRWVEYSTKPLKSDGTVEKNSYFYDSTIDRTDTVLVRVVEEMGEEANTTYSKLRIVEIPDDVKFGIDEYGGMESIHEVHRSWR